jgi:hypothetical protein
MASHTLVHYPSASGLPRWLMVGFASGFISVVVFHQGALALLHALQIVSSAPYPLAPSRPFGIPQLWSLAFWGGLWGLLLALSLGRLDGARLVLAATLFGAVLPTLVAWFIVAPLKDQPMAAGFVPLAMMVGPIVNAAWGFGTGLGLAILGRTHTSASGRAQ